MNVPLFRFSAYVPEKTARHKMNELFVKREHKQLWTVKYTVTPVSGSKSLKFYGILLKENLNL